MLVIKIEAGFAIHGLLTTLLAEVLCAEHLPLGSRPVPQPIKRHPIPDKRPFFAGTSVTTFPVIILPCHP